MWIDSCALPGLALASLAPADRAALAALPVMTLPAGQPLFQTGDRAQGFMILLEGRVEVFLTGPSGREILLYAVEPGQSCIQTTLGLIGDEVYAGAAQTTCPIRAVMIPRGQFLRSWLKPRVGEAMRRPLERRPVCRVCARGCAAQSRRSPGGEGPPGRPPHGPAEIIERDT